MTLLQELSSTDYVFTVNRSNEVGLPFRRTQIYIQYHHFLITECSAHFLYKSQSTGSHSEYTNNASKLQKSKSPQYK